MPEFVGRLRTPRLAAAPASPQVGEMYYDTALNQLFYWNGTAWISGSAGGAAIDYNGDFPANTPYTDGDIVISNGVAYMCVNPTAAAPVAWPGGPTPSPTAMPTYGTSFPASPINGQEHILVDSTTNPTYEWRYRYNANNTTANKWEFISTPRTWRVGGSTQNPAIATSAQTLVPELTLSLVGLIGRPLLVMFRFGFQTGVSGYLDSAVYLDGAQYTSGMGTDGIFGYQTFPNTGFAQNAGGSLVLPGLSGNHTIEIRAMSNVSGANYFAGRRHLHIQEM